VNLERSDLLELSLLRPALVVASSAAAEASGFREGLEVTVLGRVPGARVHVRLAGAEQLVHRELCSDVLVLPVPEEV